MKCLTIRDGQVINIRKVESDYTALPHEVLIDDLPPLELKEGEFAFVLYQDGEVVYRIEKRG